jgi:hypothetical protein
MPCYSIITQSVDLSNLGSQALLDETLQEMGFNHGSLYNTEGYFTFRNGKLNGPTDEVGKLADKIKRAYSKRSIYAAAKKKGWRVRQLSESKYQVIRG